MVRTNVWAVLALGIAATTAAAQEKTKISKGPPPEIVTVVAMDEEQGVLDLEYVGVVEMEKVRVKNTYTKRVKHKDTVLATRSGRWRPSIDKPIYKPRVLKLKLKYTEVFNASGKKLAGEQVWKRLAVGSTVVIPVDGKPVDSDYLRAPRQGNARSRFASMRNVATPSFLRGFIFGVSGIQAPCITHTIGVSRTNPCGRFTIGRTDHLF